MYCLVEGGMSPRIWLSLREEAPKRNPGVGGQTIKKGDWGETMTKTKTETETKWRGQKIKKADLASRECLCQISRDHKVELFKHSPSQNAGNPLNLPRGHWLKRNCETL